MTFHWRSLAAAALALGLTAGAAQAVTTVTFTEENRGAPNPASPSEWDASLDDPDFGVIPEGADMLLRGAFWENGEDGVKFTLLTPFKVSFDLLTRGGAQAAFDNAPDVRIFDADGDLLATELAVAHGSDIALFGRMFEAGTYSMRLQGTGSRGQRNASLAYYDLRVQAVPAPAAGLGLLTALGLAGAVRRGSRRG
ncbi:MAG: hypothetical protein AAGI51_12240 [Pseudomonadota bacterium]